MLDVMFYVCMTLIFAASVPIWRRVGKRFSQKQPIIEARSQLDSPIGLVDLGVMLFVWLLSQILAGVWFARVFGVEVNELESLAGTKMMTLMLVAGIGQLIAVAMGMGLLLARYQDARVIGWYPKFFQVDLKLAFKSFLLIAPVVLVVQLLLSMFVEYKHPAMEAMVKDANVFTVVAVWLAAVIAAPIAEEVMFRGWIQNWLQRASFEPSDFSATLAGGWSRQPDHDFDREVALVEDVLASESETVDLSEAHRRGSMPASSSNPYAATSHASLSPVDKGDQSFNAVPSERFAANNRTRDWVAIVITSLIFAMMHFGQGLAPIPLFGLSLLLGYLYQRTGSLLPCIGLHMLNNGYSVFWLTMQILVGETADLP